MLGSNLTSIIHPLLCALRIIQMPSLSVGKASELVCNVFSLMTKEPRGGYAEYSLIIPISVEVRCDRTLTTQNDSRTMNSKIIFRVIYHHNCHDQLLVKHVFNLVFA